MTRLGRRLPDRLAALGAVRRVGAELTDASSLARALDGTGGVDAVIHCAAVYSYAPSAATELTDVNVTGTRLVLEAAAAAGADPGRRDELVRDVRVQPPAGRAHRARPPRQRARPGVLREQGAPGARGPRRGRRAPGSTSCWPCRPSCSGDPSTGSARATPSCCATCSTPPAAPSRAAATSSTRATPGPGTSPSSSTASPASATSSVATTSRGAPCTPSSPTSPASRSPWPSCRPASRGSPRQPRRPGPALTSTTPLSTREEATTVGRHYWYSSDPARALGYAARPARDAVAASLAWLAVSPDLPRVVRESLRLRPEVRAARPLQPRTVPDPSGGDGDAASTAVTPRRRPPRPAPPRRRPSPR